MRKLQLNVRNYIDKLFKKDDPIKEQMKPNSSENPYVRRYTKSELAHLYKKPVYSLMRWIKQDEELFEELKATGYKTHQKEFKKEQVRIIFYHLGEPDFPN